MPQPVFIQDNKLVTYDGRIITTVDLSAAKLGTADIADDAITAAKIASAAVGTDEIAANAVASADTNTNLIQYATFELSKADILAMFGAPVEILPAGGASTAIELLSVQIACDFAVAAYTGGGDVGLVYTSDTTVVSSVVTAGNSFGAAADKLVVLQKAVGTVVPLVNKGISITNASGAFTDPGTAAGVAHIKIAYRIHATGL